MDDRPPQINDDPVMKNKSLRKERFACDLQMPSETVSRVMSKMIIYLVLPLPTVSSDLPEGFPHSGRPGRPFTFCLVLLRMGLAQPHPLPDVR